MAEYEKKVRDELRLHGCTFVRHGKGDHDVWYSPITGVHVTVDGEDQIPPYRQRDHEASGHKDQISVTQINAGDGSLFCGHLL